MDARTILIVDDNAVVVKTLSMTLLAAGYNVLAAQDAGEGISLARQYIPDLILLDISFPPEVGFDGGVAWDGFLLMDWLRRLDANAGGIPVIIITGMEGEEHRERALAAGAVNYLQKPVDPHELLAAVGAVIGEPEPQ